MKKLRIFTWNIHGGYLKALAGTGHHIYLPYKPGKGATYLSHRPEGRPYGYAGTAVNKPWPRTVHEIKASDIGRHRYNLVILHTHQQIREEQFRVLSKEQLRLPKVFIFHTPPWIKDFDSRRYREAVPVQEYRKLKKVVHITRYNEKEWHKVHAAAFGKLRPTTVIYHGIQVDPSVHYSGRIKKGITAANYLLERYDNGPIHWKRMHSRLPLVLAGAGPEPVGGIGRIPHHKMRVELAKYRLYYNPTNRSSLPMAMLEAMSAGVPVVARYATEIPNVIHNGYNGFTYRSPDRLASAVRLLLRDKRLAKQLGQNAQRTIRERFVPERFSQQWNQVLAEVTTA